MTSGPTKEISRQKISRGVQLAKAQNAHVVSFPENAVDLGSEDAAPNTVQDLQYFADLAKESDIEICLVSPSLFSLLLLLLLLFLFLFKGAMEKSDHPTKFYNSLFWFSSQVRLSFCN
jgi:hypothetical protein